MANKENTESTPFTKFSEVSGKTMHKHELLWENGEIIGHKPASKTDQHHHEIVHLANDKWYLAESADDEEDPTHTHDVILDSDKVESKIGKLLKRL